MAIDSFPSVQAWLANFDPKSATVVRYRHALRLFSGHVGKDPEQLLALAKADHLQVRNLANAWRQQLMTEGNLTVGTVNQYYADVRSFFKWNDVELGKSPRGVGLRGGAPWDDDYAPTVAEASLMLNVAPTLRDKALIAFLATTGQRQGIASALKLKHLGWPESFQGPFPLLVTIPDIFRDSTGRNVNKGRLKYRFAIPQETVRALKLMLDERRRDGEELTPESALFRSYCSSVLRQGARGIRVAKDQAGKHISKAGITARIHAVAEKAGLQKQIGTSGRDRRGKAKPRWRVHPHVFRRYWNRQAEYAGAPREFRDSLMGHVLPYGGAYDKWPRERVIEEWARFKLDDWLSLSGGSVASRGELEDLRRQVTEREAHIKTLETNLQKVVELVNEMQRLDEADRVLTRAFLKDVERYPGIRLVLRGGGEGDIHALPDDWERVIEDPAVREAIRTIQAGERRVGKRQQRPSSRG